MKCVKEISCRVISSAPFGQARVELSSGSRLNKHQYESGNIAGGTCKARSILTSVIDRDILSITFGADFPTGQILDFYA
jgi:hypothetical protein